MQQIPSPKDPRSPWPAAGAGYVNTARGGLKQFILGFVLAAFFGGAAAMGAIWPEEYLTGVDVGTGRWIAAAIAVLFIGIGLFIATGTIFAWVNPSGIAIDRSGVWYIHRRRAAQVPWPQIRAVGGSFRRKKGMPPDSIGSAIGERLADKMTTDQGRDLFAIEIFPRDPGVVTSQVALQPVWRTGPGEREPAPGLTGGRLRIVIVGFSDYRAMAGAIYQSAPGLWFGEYERA